MKGGKIKNFFTHISVCSTLRKLPYVNLKLSAKNKSPVGLNFEKEKQRKILALRLK